MTNAIESFTDRLKKLTKYEKITRKELELKTGIKASRWNNIFNTDTKPRIEELVALSEIFPEYKLYLAYGDEDPLSGQVSPDTKRAFDKGIKEIQSNKKISGISRAIRHATTEYTHKTKSSILVEGSPTNEIHDLVRKIKQESYNEILQKEVSTSLQIEMTPDSPFYETPEEASDSIRAFNYARFIRSKIL